MEVFADVAVTDVKTPPFQPLTSTVISLLLIIGMSILTESMRQCCEEHRSNNSYFYHWECHSETAFFFLFEALSFSAVLVTSLVSQGLKPRTGMKKKPNKQVWSVQYLFCILYTIGRHKHPDKGTCHTTSTRLFMNHRRKGDRGKQICHQQEAVTEWTSHFESWPSLTERNLF